MRPIRPLFQRHASADELDREAERLKNRDWVEMLRVVHPSQAERAEREYMLARLAEDWGELTSALLATHSLPTALDRGNLLVLCDHNTFANELSLIAKVVEKKISARYGAEIRIHARATKRMDWRKEDSVSTRLKKAEAPRKIDVNPALEKLIDQIARLE